MRIISQDGFYDLPYENVGISLNVNNRNQVIAWSASDFCKDDLYSVMGNYSTEANAQKAMEMLRETYQYGKKIPVQKLDESGIDKEDNITLYNTRLINDFFKGGTYVPVKVFQFPKDEDLEVQDE